jgi:tritrans,polycis-undecaprenyl-diphosphate synthase [geranylgeranyl-diphosphate specific]
MENSNPKHVAIILDGNRRFAKRLMLEPWKGHEYGAEKVEKLLDYIKELGIKEFTLYCLSVENINNRPKNELDYLFKLFRKEFRDMDRDKIKNNKIKIKFIGNLSLLPKELQEDCLRLEKETEKNTDFIVNFALAYGGREEIISAVKKILKNKTKPEELNENLFEENLYLKSKPDIIIRTGGEKRTSNFLTWQSGYSEWFFLDKFWPEFEKQDLIQCINEFKVRKRNFGK